jgi:hypothetical protein
LEETKVQREELKAEVQRLKKELETRLFLLIHFVKLDNDDTFIPRLDDVLSMKTRLSGVSGMAFTHLLWDGLV